MRLVDRRSEQRLTADQLAQVTLLGASDSRFLARILDLSGRGMRLLVDRALSPGSLVKVEAEDVLILGEVCYSLASNPGFEVGLELQHSLIGLRELARRRTSLLLENEVAAGRR
jgi:hypothetical protein